MDSGHFESIKLVNYNKNFKRILSTIFSSLRISCRVPKHICRPWYCIWQIGKLYLLSWRIPISQGLAFQSLYHLRRDLFLFQKCQLLTGTAMRSWILKGLRKETVEETRTLGYSAINSKLIHLKTAGVGFLSLLQFPRLHEETSVKKHVLFFHSNSAYRSFPSSLCRCGNLTFVPS